MKYFDLEMTTVNTNIMDLDIDTNDLEQKLQKQLRNEFKRDFTILFYFWIPHSEKGAQGFLCN